MTGPEKLFGFVGTTTVRTSKEWEMILAGDGAGFLWGAGASELLALCGRWRPLDGHVSAIERALTPDGQRQVGRDQIFAFLHAMVGRRLLRNAAEMGLGARPAARGAPLTRFAITTADRPQLLQRCLASILGNVDETGRQVDGLVSDDSYDAANQRRNAHALARARLRTGRRIQYLGPYGREKLGRLLGKAAGVAPEILCFTLLGDRRADLRTYGANRNCLLLQLAGERILSFDDDTLCQFSPAQDAAAKLTFADNEDHLEFRFYPSLRGSLAASVPAPIDIFGLHGEMLGVSANDYEDFRAVSPDEYPRPALWARIGLKRIAATFTGIVGDCAYASTAPLLFLRGPSHERLVASEGQFRASLRSRAILRAMTRPFVSDSVYSTATLAGLDLRSIVPPYIPVCRDEDAVFGMLVKRCLPDVAFGHIPVAAVHWPLPERQGKDADIAATLPAHSCLRDVLSVCLSFSQQPLSGLPARDALSAAGRTLLGLAALSVADFAALIRPAILNLTALHIHRADEILTAFSGEPAYWAREVEGVRKHFVNAITDRDYWVPVELAATGVDALAAALQTQQVIGKIGHMLIEWPNLFEAAMTLRKTGKLQTIEAG